MIQTGERFVLSESTGRTHDDHVARYEFASQFVKGKVVLDIACGTGYGSSRLANAGAQMVEGVDIDVETIVYAERRYASESVHFTCASASAIPFSDRFFDSIVSFETIEHLEAPIREQYLREIGRVLKDDGVLILSTPNKKITSPWKSKPNNKFHVIEFTRKSLSQELTRSGFFVKEWYGQRRVRRIYTWYVIRMMIRLFEHISRRQFHLFDIADGAHVSVFNRSLEPRYFVLLVTKNTIGDDFSV